MLSIPLPYINFRIHRRIIVTIIGITISVMFVISSFIVVNSLSTSTGALLDRFKKNNSVLYEGDSLSESKINLNQLNLKGEYAAGILIDVKMNGTMPAFFLGIYDPLWGSGSKWISDCNISNNEVKIGEDLLSPTHHGNLTITSKSETVLKKINGTFTSSLFPSSWLIGSINTARTLAPWFGQEEYSFVLVNNTTQATIDAATSNSLTINLMPNAVSFYSEGTNQLERDLWFVLIIASIVITILIYTTMSMELFERKKDIGIMRGIGAGTKTIFFIFFTQTVILAIIGGLLGCFTGVIASYAVISLGVHIGYKTMFVVSVSPSLVGISLALTFIATLIGGIYPILKASQMKVSECME